MSSDALSYESVAILILSIAALSPLLSSTHTDACSSVSPCSTETAAQPAIFGAGIGLFALVAIVCVFATNRTGKKYADSVELLPSNMQVNPSQQRNPGPAVVPSPVARLTPGNVNFTSHPTPAVPPTRISYPTPGNTGTPSHPTPQNSTAIQPPPPPHPAPRNVNPTPQLAPANPISPVTRRPPVSGPVPSNPNPVSAPTVPNYAPSSSRFQARRYPSVAQRSSRGENSSSRPTPIRRLPDLPETSISSPQTPAPRANSQTGPLQVAEAANGDSRSTLTRQPSTVSSPPPSYHS